MTCWKTLSSTTALATLVLAQSAAADVTPDQVWADLKGYMESYGYAITATEQAAGGTLTVTDITMTVPIPEEDASLTMIMPEITMTANGGAVDVAWPAEMPVTLQMRGDGEEVVATILYESSGQTMTVSGDPGDTAWDYSAASTTISLADLVVEGDTVPREVGRGEIVMTGLKGRSAMKTGELRELEQQLSVDNLSYDIAARNPEAPEESLLFKGALDGLSYDGTGTLPLDIDPEDPSALMQVMVVDGSFAYDSGNTQFNFSEDGETASFTSSSAGGVFKMALNPQSWAYDFLVRSYDIQAQGGEIPFPVSIKSAEFGGNFAMPVAKTDDPQDVSAGINLTDFEMNDMIWNTFDPGKQLPRDPATIRLDLTGKAKMLFNIFDPEQAEAMANSDMPAELHELTLNALVIKAVGVMLNGTGAFTFDNSDLQTFGGMPRPQGELNAELSGANALIDKLVAMGLLPEEQAMGARMMMGMFAVSTGDDKMTSKIEINEQGHILANGQRIQ